MKHVQFSSTANSLWATIAMKHAGDFSQLCEIAGGQLAGGLDGVQKSRRKDEGLLWPGIVMGDGEVGKYNNKLKKAAYYLVI